MSVAFPYQAEVRLLRWGESSSAGRTITLELPPDAGEGHPFKGFPTGHTHGQRFHMQFSIIADDEQPVPQAGAQDRKDATRGDPLARGTSAKERRPWHTLPPQQRAGMLCSDKAFQVWLTGEAATESDTATVLKEACGIASRAELAANSDALTRFEHIEGEFLRDSGRVPEIR